MGGDMTVELKQLEEMWKRSAELSLAEVCIFMIPETV